MDVVGGATAAGVTLGTLYNYLLLYDSIPPPFAIRSDYFENFYLYKY